MAAPKSSQARTSSHKAAQGNVIGRRIEWIAAAISGVLVLGLCVHLLVEGLAQRDGMASIALTITNRQMTAAGEAVTVEARNLGRKAALGVEIEGTLGTETSSVTVDFLPAGGNKPVILVFSGPSDGLELRVTGYTEP